MIRRIKTLIDCLIFNAAIRLFARDSNMRYLARLELSKMSHPPPQPPLEAGITGMYD